MKTKQQQSDRFDRFWQILGIPFILLNAQKFWKIEKNKKDHSS